MELSEKCCVVLCLLLSASSATCRPVSGESSVVVADDTHDVEETSGQNCQTLLTAKIETCLLKFEQLYVTYTNADSPVPDYRANLASRMCHEYEETLHCLHLVLMSCTPGQPHLNLIEYRIGSQEMRNFIRVTCNSEAQTTPRSTSTTTTQKTSTLKEDEVDTASTSTSSSPDLPVTDRTTYILQQSTTSYVEINPEAAVARDDKHQDLLEGQGSTNADSAAESPNFTLNQEDGYIKFEIEETRNNDFHGSSSLTDTPDCSQAVNHNREACKDKAVNASIRTFSSLSLTLLALMATCTILLKL